jgi:ArsR family transcriptional regulator, arsenate/arsenite/antimonite-responsive transcriptional repressor
MTTSLERIERLFKALSDATRLRILALLVDGEVCVCHLHETLRVPQPTVSRHLAYLRRSGLVDTRREGLWIYYRLAKLDDVVLRTLTDIATHALGHVDRVAKDVQRLRNKTGCCVPEVASALVTTPDVSRSRRQSKVRAYAERHMLPCCGYQQGAAV